MAVGTLTSATIAGCSGDGDGGNGESADDGNDESDDDDDIQDTDGDGVIDSEDYAPNDPDIQREEQVTEDTDDEGGNDEDTDSDSSSEDTDSDSSSEDTDSDDSSEDTDSDDSSEDTDSDDSSEDTGDEEENQEQPEPEFEFAELTPENTNVEYGENVAVNVVVSNVGDEEGKANIEFKIADEDTEDFSITIDTDSQETISTEIDTLALDEGEYEYGFYTESAEISSTIDISITEPGQIEDAIQQIEDALNVLRGDSETILDASYRTSYWLEVAGIIDEAEDLLNSAENSLDTEAHEDAFQSKINQKRRESQLITKIAETHTEFDKMFGELEQLHEQITNGVSSRILRQSIEDSRSKIGSNISDIQSITDDLDNGAETLQSDKYVEKTQQFENVLTFSSDFEEDLDDYESAVGFLDNAKRSDDEDETKIEADRAIQEFRLYIQSLEAIETHSSLDSFIDDAISLAENQIEEAERVRRRAG